MPAETPLLSPRALAPQWDCSGLTLPAEAERLPERRLLYEADSVLPHVLVKKIRNISKAMCKIELTT